jgi:xanthine phosphoribosyltransferase
MDTKSLEEIKIRFESIRLREQYDMIVAIANGGIIPAALLNQRLDVEIQLLKLHLRDASQKPLYDRPKLLEDIRFDVKDKTILLVEDRVKTGATLNYAKQLLTEAGAKTVKTFAVNGKADYCLYDETCFMFPWIINEFHPLKI